jgi:Nickel responsive protein SCO4226-like
LSAHLFLERTFDPPLTVADVHERVRGSGWCFAMHRVDWRASFLAADGTRMVCWFKARDAESVRLALRQSGADITHLWPGTVHEAPRPAVPSVLVERSFDAPVTLAAIQALGAGSAWCLATHRVRYSRTFFSADPRRMLCLYEAPDAESVRITQQEAAMPVAAAWSFRTIAPDTL